VKGELMRGSRRKASVYLALLFAVLAWGLSFLATKNVVKAVPIFSLLFLRFSLASILLGILAAIKGQLRVPRRELLVLAGLSFLSPISYFLFETFGVFYTQPSHVAAILAAIPTVVLLISLLRHQERPTRGKVMGIIIAYIGIFLLVVSGGAKQGASVLGDVLVLGAVLCAAIRTVIVKDVLRRVTALQLTFYQFFFSLFIFGPLAATEQASWHLEVTPAIVLEILFLGIVCSAGAFFAIHYALTYLPATQVAASINLIPIITLFAEMLLMGTNLTLLKGLGVATTIAGVTLTQFGGRYRRTFATTIEEG